MPELEITIPSRRYYLDEIRWANKDKNILRSVAMTMVRFNVMAEWMYNRMYDKKYLGIEYAGTLTAMAKEEYSRRYGGKLADYYITSMNSVASGVLSSQRELQRMYDQEHEERQEHRRQKVESLTDERGKLMDLKQLFVQRSRAKKAGEPFDDSCFKDYRITVDDSGVLFRGAKGKMAKLGLYQYECRLDRKLKNLKQSIALVSEKIRVADEKYTGIPKRAVFGTKKQYRKKDTVCRTWDDMTSWHRERDFARYHCIRFSGRSTSAYGNFQCRYDPAKRYAEISLIDGNVLALENLFFPYRGEEITARRLEEGHPYVAYSLEWKKDGRGRDYFVLKASFPSGTDRVNECTDTGVVAFDLNYDHIAISDINADGALLETKVIRFNTAGKSSGEAASIIGHAVKEAMDYAEQKKKPVAKEALSIRKTKLEYGSKKANRRISAFAYHQMEACIAGQALRRGIGIIEVDPAYTSFLGKVKYMKQYGISIHCAASYVIGRRALGLTERLPQNLRSVYYKKKRDGTVVNVAKGPWAAYRNMYNHIKNIPTAFWYGDVTFTTWKSLDAQVNTFKKEHGYA